MMHQVYAECFAEEYISRKILGGRVSHRKVSGIGWVVNEVTKATNRPVVGLIDSDKGVHVPKLVSTNFKTLQEENNIHFSKHTSKEVFLIQLNSNFEEWVAKECIRLGLDMSTYNLDSNQEKLSKELARFKRVSEHNQIKRLLDFLLNDARCYLHTHYKRYLHEALRS